MSARSAQLQTPHVSPETFKTLCSAAVEFGLLAPWEFLCDTAMLGIRETATGQSRLASVMGNGGAPFGLFLSRGRQGLRWAIELGFEHKIDTGADPNFTYSYDALMVEFVPRLELAKHDLDLLNQVDFKPSQRTERPWLKFRSYRPGAAPWFLEQAEAELLLSDLRIIIAFARLVAEKKSLFDDYAENEVPFFSDNVAFTHSLRAENLDRQALVSTPDPWPVPVLLSDSELTELAALPLNSEISLELDCLYGPGVVDEPPRPHYPWVAIAADARTGRAYHSTIENSQIVQQPEPVAVRCLVDTMIHLKCRPDEIHVARGNLAFVLRPIGHLLGIRAVQTSRLVGIEKFYRGLLASTEPRLKT